MSKNINHSINYIEFQVIDIEQAKAFYRAAFDWKFTDYGPTYSGIQKPDGGEMGGLTVSETVQPGGPLVVLYSDNLEDSFGKVQSANGIIAKEIFTFPGGRRFHFKDPSGNELAVWGF